MGRIGLVTWREYITRVRKKSFLIMTFVGPLLIAAFYGTIIYFAVNETVGRETEKVLVYDAGHVLNEGLKSDELMAFEYTANWGSREASELEEGAYSGRLYIPDTLQIYHPKGILYESANPLSIESQERMNHRIARCLSARKMAELGLSKSALDSVETSVSILPSTIGEDGSLKNTSTELNTVIGMVLSFIIYFFIFIYGVQVMKGVIEEKSNRIVEIIVSSVKPFQLMMGKVFGLALVGLTQILMWVVLSGVLMSILSVTLLGSDLGSIMDLQKAMPQQAMEQYGLSEEMTNSLTSLFELNFSFIIAAFIVYFIGGYLMYSALFASVGAAVDEETDTQQFMLPLTMPLVFAIALSTSVIIRDPNGPVGFWLSMIPLTSPIAMMVRAPFLNLATQWWEVALSVGLLIGAFTFTIWIAGRIYRIGILSYGKKATYKELFKWLFYKA